MEFEKLNFCARCKKLNLLGSTNVFLEEVQLFVLKVEGVANYFCYEFKDESYVVCNFYTL